MTLIFYASHLLHVASQSCHRSSHKHNPALTQRHLFEMYEQSFKSLHWYCGFDVEGQMDDDGDISQIVSLIQLEDSLILEYTPGASTPQPALLP
mmetsp:Transcript_35647/g.78122  ORF Transcript_35647/g.78122 Transcript_35647/m.78122 type:complete len:94 (+) Transcript_35647:2-283(+)